MQRVPPYGGFRAGTNVRPGRFPPPGEHRGWFRSELQMRSHATGRQVRCLPKVPPCGRSVRHTRRPGSPKEQATRQGQQDEKQFTHMRIIRSDAKLHFFSDIFTPGAEIVDKKTNISDAGPTKKGLFAPVFDYRGADFGITQFGRTGHTEVFPVRAGPRPGRKVPVRIENYWGMKI